MRADTGKPRARHAEDHAWVFTVSDTSNEICETTIVDRYGERLAKAVTVGRASPAATSPGG